MVGTWRHMLKNEIALREKAMVGGENENVDRLMLIIMTLDEDDNNHNNEKFNINIYASLSSSSGEGDWVISAPTAATTTTQVIDDIRCIDICAAAHYDNINCHDNANSRFIIIKFQFTASHHDDDKEIETKNVVANATRTAAMPGEERRKSEDIFWSGGERKGGLTKISDRK